MKETFGLPPDPSNAVLRKIYPWDQYNITIVLQWLYKQAKKTGFPGTFDDFKLRYGKFVEASDPQEITDLIDKYEGSYHITPLVNIEQVLQTKNKVLDQNIIIDPVPEYIIDTKPIYQGRYVVTPMAAVDQILRTNDTIMESNVIVEKIPYQETSNEAGGYTVIIG